MIRDGVVGMGDALRSWQKEALEIYRGSLERGQRFLLIEATPGAGKTTAALRICLHQLRQSAAKRILIVVPTTHLKLQWARAATAVGLHLDTRFGEKQRTIARDFHGLVLTYQQVGNRHRFFSQLSRDAVVILDEVHHSGDGLSWGDALRLGFSEAQFILSLSGTAFRSDNNKIPFVHYDKSGISNPDYVYSYTRAIEERVCRPTVFFTYGGEVAWSDRELQEQASFSDALDRKGRTKRLRAALDPESGWIEPMLQDAHTMLSATRAQHANAAGLMVTSSQRHARSLARVLTKVSGTKPVVVLSEDSSASEKLKSFAAGTEQWLVACNMVSEGVDIPRLRIGVYATTISTKMYFRQFLGRIVRRTLDPSGAQPAFCYLPADPLLRRLAEEIEQEQKHCINLAPDDLFGQDFDLPEREKPEKEESTWRALQSRNSGLDSVIMGGGQLSLFQGAQADSELDQFAMVGQEALIIPSTNEQFLSRTELKEQIVKEIRSLVTSYHHYSGQPHSHIHAMLNSKQHVKNQQNCTELQLQERLEILQQLIRV